MGKQADGAAGWNGWTAPWRVPLCLPDAARLAEVALLGSAGALLGMLGWVLLAPLGPVPGSGNAGPMVLDAPARASLFAQFDPFGRETPDGGTGGANGGAVPLTLLGTRSTPDGLGGSAIVAGADGVQQVVMQGQDALPGMRLAQVAFDHVVLLRAGARITLWLGGAEPPDAPPGASPGAPPAASAAPAAPASFDGGHGAHGEQGGPGAARAAATASLPVAVADDGTALVPVGAAAQAWGLLPQDRIVAIAGSPVRGAGDANRLMAQLAGGQPVAVTVRRGGRNLALSLAPGGGGR